MYVRLPDILFSECDSVVLSLYYSKYFYVLFFQIPTIFTPLSKKKYMKKEESWSFSIQSSSHNISYPSISHVHLQTSIRNGYDFY